MEVIKMAIGQRKSGIEKLKLQFQDVQDAIAQYETCIDTLKNKIVWLTEQLNQEEFKEIKQLLDKQGLSISDLKEMVQEISERQSA